MTKLVDTLDAGPADTFVEIGPGRGALTRALAPRVARLVGVEIDRDLAAHLAATSPPHVDHPCGDFLEFDLASLIPAGEGPVRVMGNLPYNIGAPILFRLFGWAAGGAVVRDATVMLQQEVADRMLASPGTSEYGVLSIYTQPPRTHGAALDAPAGRLPASPARHVHGAASDVSSPACGDRAAGNVRPHRPWHLRASAQDDRKRPPPCGGGAEP